MTIEIIVILIKMAEIVQFEKLYEVSSIHI